MKRAKSESEERAASEGGWASLGANLRYSRYTSTHPPCAHSSLLQAMHPPGPGQRDPAQPSSHQPVRSPRLPSSPVLLHPLPPSSSLHAESLSASELELVKQTADTKRERDLAEALQEQEWQVQRDHARGVVGSSGRSRETQDPRDRSDSWGSSKAFARPPQAWELYRAIDKKDIDFVMRVRDHSFGLLLQKNAGEWPIIYAAKAGASHRDILILMLGAMSRSALGLGG